MAIRATRICTLATTMLGAAYGYRAAIFESDFADARTRKPPIRGPSRDPMFADKGRSVRARARYLISTISTKARYENRPSRSSVPFLRIQLSSHASHHSDGSI